MGVNGAVHYVVQMQKILVTVLSLWINYVPNSVYEIGHTMYSTATEASCEVQNIYTAGVQIFYAKGPYPLLWAGSRTASESITVVRIRNV